MNLWRTIMAGAAVSAALCGTAAAADTADLAKKLRALHATKAVSLGSFTLAATAPTPPPPPPPPPASGCPVAGYYRVDGNNPGNPQQYHGTAQISERDGGCYMRWSAPNSSEGTGTYYNGQLKISFWGLGGGGGGIVVYSGRPGGPLSGPWWMHGQEGNQGYETITPN